MPVLKYDRRLFDNIALQVEHAIASGVNAQIADARSIPTHDNSVDAVIMLGPMFHLVEPAERAKALYEAWRVLRPGEVLVGAALSRWGTAAGASRSQRTR